MWDLTYRLSLLVVLALVAAPRAQAPDEWTDVEVESAEQSVQVAMTIVPAVAGMP